MWFFNTMFFKVLLNGVLILILGSLFGFIGHTIWSYGVKELFPNIYFDISIMSAISVMLFIMLIHYAVSIIYAIYLDYRLRKKAIEKIGEVQHNIIQQMEELEKSRMEFSEDLDYANIKIEIEKEEVDREE